MGGSGHSSDHSHRRSRARRPHGGDRGPDPRHGRLGRPLTSQQFRSRPRDSTKLPPLTRGAAVGRLGCIGITGGDAQSDWRLPFFCRTEDFAVLLSPPRSPSPRDWRPSKPPMRPTPFRRSCR
ncbi:hypothetical protein SBRY_50500 [Actinacidiphila bryophytorum]|uniref:Uncharacterized protein n=1 Tax=Actinacidiphila bryophytorum TaxID=1436133 RepID=A0A9W4MEY7_9ACTN|nr:hypothetical protein SBRY_50500 [Actinacidiphila bryophytorum]